MGNTTEFAIYDLTKFDQGVRKHLNFADFGTIVEGRYFVIMNASEWDDLNPYYVFLWVLKHKFGLTYKEIDDCEIRTNQYLNEDVFDGIAKGYYDNDTD